MRFGSVGGGGRYDGLVSRFRGEPVPATGFSIGVSRLQAALTALGKIGEEAGAGAGGGHVFDRDRIADYQKHGHGAAQCRHSRRTLSRQSEEQFGNQMKYADKRGSPCAVIQGGDEKARGEVQIKDLILGAEIAGLQGPRRIFEEAGRSAVRGARGQIGRGGAAGARQARPRLTLQRGGAGGRIFWMSSTFIFMPLAMMTSPGF